MSKARSRGTVHRGNVAIICALGLLAMLAAAALGTDIAWLVESGAELRTAADFSALSAVEHIRIDEDHTRQVAHDIAEANEAAAAPVLLDMNAGNDASGDIVLGRWSCPGDEYGHAGEYICTDGSFRPLDLGANAVKVAARRTSSSNSGPIMPILGEILGYQYHEMQREAIAIVTGSAGTGIVVLCDTPQGCNCAFDINGGGTNAVTLNVRNAAIHVNSYRPNAACFNGHSGVAAGEMNIVNQNESTATSIVGGAEFFGDMNFGVDPMPDPLEDLPDPTYDPTNDLSCTYGGEAVLTPGYYSNGLTFASGGNFTLTAGEYILGNAVVPNGQQTGAIDFDNSGAESGITTAGATDFNYDTMSWTGGTVTSTPVGGPPPTYPLSASGDHSYHIGVAGGTVTFNPPVNSATFYYVHDGLLGVPQGTATAIDTCGGVTASAASKPSTLFNDPANFVTLTTNTTRIARIEFSGGAIDALSFSRQGNAGNGGFNMSGGSTVVAEGVMLFIQSGGVSVAGNSVLQITPPSSGTYEGIAFFQARDNVSTSNITGVTDTIINGMLYFPAALLDIGGTADSFGLGNGIIAWKLRLSGDSEMEVVYNADPGEGDVQTYLVR